MGKVIVEKDGYLTTVILNRPEQLNCFDFETLLQLEEVLEDIKTDLETRAVIFTGAGEKAFSAGADLKERKTLSEREVRRNVFKIRDVFNAVEDLPQPTIAAINGFALGGGFELALACDFRYAVPEAEMGLTEVSWAIIPGAGGTQRLPRLIGPTKAKELILTAERITADEALKLGILSGVVERKELLKKAKELAEKIMKNGPIAVRQAKYAINNGLKGDFYTGIALESKAYEVTIPTTDRLEALLAFQEKRKPLFKGK
ncbi:enoyl-CoA hydratase-related protein [Calidifontibacillus erzurumensis]|uniref:Enoyl-CoA hydratase/isomerase family protein n=1 Tax=Calidifontibacillus erzurumensis TaxID=2741433 RepID=A0A8J8GB28_9BACI|nr:enoyl-CoA hydratase-related protein [Calidifontibacillus erzurumensis]NSL50524.1 enoyl-CoA hydratase/isomerase family protein [Calidifontibacillus erzurumensis]